MSTLSLRRIKHDSASVDNVTLNTDGGVGIGGIDPSTLPIFIDHAVRVQNGGGLGIQSANATDNRWIFFGHGTANLDVQRAGIVNQGSNQSLALATAGTQRLIVDASGRVTMPFQPSFHARGLNSMSSFVSGADVIFPTVVFNNGSHYNSSNGRFTAPVTGTYVFGWTNIGAQANDVYRWRFRVNGSNVGDIHLRQDTGASGSEYATNGMYVIPWNLTQGDFVNIYFQSDSGNAPYGNGTAADDYPRFWGYLQS